jgi:hypothetical protein
VYRDSNCENYREKNHSNNRNHAVAIVGYGVLDGDKYWIMKNSWGTGWGTNGFLKFLRGPGHCGFAMEISVPMCTATGDTPNTTAGPGPSPSPGPTSEPEPSCGGTLTAASGEMISMKESAESETYLNDQDCIWNIQPKSATEGQVIKFTVVEFDLEQHDTCAYDYVQFSNKDGSHISLGSGEAADAGKLCGKIIPSPFFSISNQATVKFHSDSSETGKGFKIQYEVVTQQSCENQELITSTGIAPVEFTSCNYPSNYDNDDNCDWTISVPKGEVISLAFTDFETEDGYDHVLVIDGDNDKDPWLGRFSGSNKPERLTSTGNKMKVLFTSDGSVSAKGFSAVASAENK